MSGPGLLRKEFLCCLLILTYTQQAITQTQVHSSPANPGNVGPTRIQINVEVTDAAGKAVIGLWPQDFTVLDDGQPQRIVSFGAFDDAMSTPDPPVQILLLIDTINGSSQERRVIQQGAAKFLRQNQGLLAHPVSLIILSAFGIRLPSPPSTDGNALAKSVDQIGAGPGLDLPGRYWRSMAALSQIALAEERVPGRKLLIWLGPGWPVNRSLSKLGGRPIDTRSAQSELQSIAFYSNELRKAQITLFGGYSFAPAFRSDLFKPPQTPADVNALDLDLVTLAYQTGGSTVLNSSNPNSDPADQINSYVADADTFYSFAFEAAITDPVLAYHSLKVLVDKPGLIAHTNFGYYDQPSQSPAQAQQFDLSQIGSPYPDQRDSVAEPPKPITVNQLQQLLRDAHKKSDTEVALRLSSLRLTERLSRTLLPSLQSALPGPKARQALTALADQAAFLEPPPAQIPSAEPPDPTEQKRIWSLVVEYLSRKTAKLPDFFATQINTEYKEVPVKTKILGITTSYHPMWSTFATTRATVLYRDGKEVLHPEPTKQKQRQQDHRGIQTSGTFGIILSTVVNDATASGTSWSHWESGASGPEAVFHFVVPRDRSHYRVNYKSFSGNAADDVYNHLTAYHGEIAVDPAVGTILRLTLQADLEPGLPISQSDLLVEYGTVDIGGMSYTCPENAVAISSGRTILSAPGSLSRAYGPTQQILDDISFSRYHVFRTESKILY